MPARLRDLARALRAFNVEVVEGGGKHNYRATRTGCRVYTIPAHRGWQTEVADCYISGACRHFGLDRTELWKLIRRE